MTKIISALMLTGALMTGTVAHHSHGVHESRRAVAVASGFTGRDRMGMLVD